MNNSNFEENGGSSSPFERKKRQSTLLNETGNVEIYRVSEETRKKVYAETKAIERQRLNNNQRSRANFYKTENEKIKAREGNYRSMVHRWEKKLANSPYLANQVELAEQRQAHFEEWEREKRSRAERQKLVLSLSGKAAVGLASEDRIKSFDAGTKLAISLRQTLRVKETIAAEHKLLNHMLLEEVSAIKRSFPSASIPDDLFKEDLEADDLTFPESLTSKSMSFTSGNSLLKMIKRKNRGPSREQKLSKPVEAGVDEQESSTFTGPLSYTAPTAKIQELENDLEDLSFTHER